MNIIKQTKYSFYWRCKYCNLVNDWKNEICSHCGSQRGKATLRHLDEECFTEYHPEIHREVHETISEPYYPNYKCLIAFLVPCLSGLILLLLAMR